MRVLVVFSILLFSTFSLVVGPSAVVLGQQPTGDCTISIAPSTIVINVDPEAESNNGSALIRVSNPTQFTENISIQYQTSGLAYDGLRNVTLLPFDEVNFTMNISAVPGAVHSALPGSVTCQVDQINWLDNPVPVQKKTDFIISLRQYAALDASLDLNPMMVQKGTVFNVTGNLTNVGNFRDNYRVEIRNRAILEEEGFVFSFVSSREVEAGATESVVFTNVNTDGVSVITTRIFLIEVLIHSQFSLDFDAEEDRVNQTLFLNLTLLPEPPSDDDDDGIPGFGAVLAILALMVVLFVSSLKRKDPIQ